MLVPHSDLVDGTAQPMEVSETEAAVSTVENQQPAEDPPTLKFTWTVPNFSRQNTRKHYSQVHMSLELCFKRRAPFAPRRTQATAPSPCTSQARVWSLRRAPWCAFSLNLRHLRH